MPRYVTGFIGDEPAYDGAVHPLNEAPKAMTIVAIDAEPTGPVKTGLLTHRGEMIYRLPDKVKCGF